ncbi:AAA family ATPase [Paenibacillus sp. OV219]|uniref:AAA family ATPase n=1 Tax=Paenibacillus sp. OV219 TaxID=1884377 RepID=UPI0008AC1374|nr:AAA family ATPase [Paenibacillus sp. OV219]SEN97973.1 Guanylate kinase [Paenibacillus sp. OV219]
MSNVILISGPSGSGKTALSEYLGATCHFAVVSEDKFWGEYKANCPVDEGRTLEEEVIIQNQVATKVEQLLQEGKNVVLEFILYCDPPRPLLAYQEALQGKALNLTTVLLKPSVEVILDRKRLRGRISEQNSANETTIGESQLSCLDSPYIKKEWIVNNDSLTISETYEMLARDNRHIFE